MRGFPSPIVPSRFPVIIPEEKLAEVLDFWVAWLGLTGWTHRFQLVTAKQFESFTQTGGANWNLAAQHFNVYVLDPSEVEDDDTYDQEQVIVHELLHVVYAAWLDNSPEFNDRDGVLFETCVEQPNERVAKVLTALGRAHPSHPLKKKRSRR